MPGTKRAPTHVLAAEAPDASPDLRETETDFERLAERALSRRGFVAGGVTFGAAAFVAAAGGRKPLAALANDSRFGFEPVAANALDTVTVPKGYRWYVVARWGRSDVVERRGFRPEDARHRGEPGTRLRRQQ